MKKGYFAPSVKKAFEILKLISTNREGLGISEIARDLRIAKSTVHGMTSALEESGAIRRDPETKRYTLGFTLFELGRLAYSKIDLKDIARPFMNELVEKMQVSAFLGVLNWDHVTVIDVVEPRTELKITAPIGTTIPVLAGAAGKVFLAMMEEEQAVKLIRSKGLPKYTPRSITDQETYIGEIRAVKERGFAIDDEEYLLGVRAVAAPIQRGEQSISAIWVVGFKASLDQEKMRNLVEGTRDAGKAIRKKMETQAVTAF